MGFWVPLVLIRLKSLEKDDHKTEVHDDVLKDNFLGFPL